MAWCAFSWLSSILPHAEMWEEEVWGGRNLYERSCEKRVSLCPPRNIFLKIALGLLKLINFAKRKFTLTRTYCEEKLHRPWAHSHEAVTLNSFYYWLSALPWFITWVKKPTIEKKYISTICHAINQFGNCVYDLETNSIHTAFINSNEIYLQKGHRVRTPQDSILVPCCIHG